MLREESEVHSLEEQEEMSLSVVFGILAPSQFANPEVESCKNSKYRTHGQHVVEMRNDVVSHLRLASALLVLPQGPDFLLSRF